MHFKLTRYVGIGIVENSNRKIEWCGLRFAIGDVWGGSLSERSMANSWTRFLKGCSSINGTLGGHKTELRPP